MKLSCDKWYYGACICRARTDMYSEEQDNPVLINYVSYLDRISVPKVPENNEI